MKICLVGPTYPYRGGIAHYTTLLCRELRRSHEVKFVSFKRQYPKWLFPGKTDKDVSGEPLQIDNVDRLVDSLNPFTWYRAAHAICAFQPELLVIPWWVAYWAPSFHTIVRHVKRSCNATVVFLCHNVVEHESSRIKQWCTRKVLAHGDRFVVHSREERDDLVKLLPGADVSVGFHPTYEGLAGQRYGKDEAKRKLGLNGPAVLFFGFVREYKGLGPLLEAMPRVRERVPATLLVVGEFWKDKPHYLDAVRRLGLEQAVRIVDEYVPNEKIPLYFGASDLVCLPYVSGTGSGVAQLAFGLDRPVVATRIGCLADVVEDGVSGRLVPPGQPDALADAIAESLRPETLEVLMKGAAEAKARFSWERMARLIVGESSSTTQA